MGFVTGTLILSADGYRPIEQLRTGDAVMSRGRRFRPVAGVRRGFGDPLVHVKAQGVAGLNATPDQRFLTHDGLWLPAVQLRNPLQRRVVQTYPEAFPIADPLVAERASPRFWWLVGRYLGNGWLSRRYSRQDARHCKVCFAVPPDRAWSFEPKLTELGLRANRQDTRTSARFTISNSALARFLEQFGDRSDTKCLPGWVYSLERADAQRLIEGYRSGAGNERPNGDTRINTVSKPLAYGMALLVQRAYDLVCSVSYQPTQQVTEIESRLVKQRDYWSLTIPFHNRSGRIDGALGYKVVRETRPIGRDATWSLRIEGDNSYLADGAIVEGAAA